MKSNVASSLDEARRAVQCSWSGHVLYKWAAIFQVQDDFRLGYIETASYRRPTTVKSHDGFGNLEPFRTSYSHRLFAIDSKPLTATQELTVNQNNEQKSRQGQTEGRTG